jgi:hypothetical protein
MALAAANCAACGAIVRDARWHQSVDSTAVAFASPCEPSAEPTAQSGPSKPLGEAKAPAGSIATEFAWRLPPAAADTGSDTPALLSWRPLVVAGRGGTAKIEFDIPQKPRSYRIFVDAHAEGRLGSATAPLAVRAH